MKHLKVFLLTLVLFGFSISPNWAQSNNPILTIGCLSDLHCGEASGSNSSSGTLATSATTTVQQLKQTENLDAIFVGGDIVSGNNPISQDKWNACRINTIDALLSAFQKSTTSAALTGAKTATPLYIVTGNHDFQPCGTKGSYNSGDYYNTITVNGASEYGMEYYTNELKSTTTSTVSANPNEAYFETLSGVTDSKGKNHVACYHYQLNGIDIIGINTSTETYNSASSTPWRYSDGQANWVAKKLELLTQNDKYKRILVVEHIPFRDNDNGSEEHGLPNSTATSTLKSAMAKCPNLIMFFGHDHTSSTCYISTNTSERVTHYDSNGNKLTKANTQSHKGGSFSSVFMGSMNYRSYQSVYQTLMIYVYSDRVVLSMKNYGATGTVGGSSSWYGGSGSATFNDPTNDYTIYMTNGQGSDTPSVDPEPQPATGDGLYLKNMGNSKYLQMVKKATDDANNNNNDGQLGFVSSMDGNTTDWAFTQYNSSSLVKFADSSNSNHVYFGNKGDNNYGYKLTGINKYNSKHEAAPDNQSSAGAGSKYNCYLYKITNYSASGTSFTATLTTTAEAGGYYFIASANVQSSSSSSWYGQSSSSTGLVLMGNNLNTSSSNQITIDGTQISSTPGSSSITVNISNIQNYIYQFVSNGSTPQPTDKTLYGTLSVSGSNGTVFASATQGAGSGSTSVSVNKAVAQSVTSASQTIYLHATANANYTFQGWSETNGGSVIAGSNVAEYAYTFTFSGTSQSAATSKTLYAVFQQNGSSDQPTTGDGTYYIKNVNKGTYFTSTSSQSSLSSTKQAFTFKSLDNEGLYQVSFSTGGTTYAIDYEQLKFAPITPTTSTTDNLYFYEIADINANTLTATQVQTVSTGKYYFILGTSKNSGNTYVLSNEPYNNGSLGAVQTTDGSHASSISLSKSDGASCIYTLESDGSTPIVPPTPPTGGDDEFYISNGGNYVNMPSADKVQLSGSKQAWTITAGASANTFKMTASYNNRDYTFYYSYEAQGFSPISNITEYEDEYTGFYFFDASTGKLATSLAAGNSYYIVVKSLSGNFYMYNNSVSDGYLQRQQLQNSTNNYYISAATSGDITTSTTVSVTSNAANYQFTLESTGTTPQPTTKTLYGQLAVAATNGTAFISATSGAASGSSTVTVSAEVATDAEKSSAVLYLNATPASDYEFVGWSTDNAGSNIISTVSSNYAYTFEFGGTQTLPTNVTLYAIFKQKSQPTPTTKTLWGQLTVAATYGNAFISATSGATTGGNVMTVSEEVAADAEKGTKVLYLSAVPTQGYEFVGWSKDNTESNIISTVSSNFAYTFEFGGTQTLPTGLTLYAIFKQQSQPDPTTKTLYGRVSVSAAHGTAFVTETSGATSGGNVLTVSSEVDKAASVATKTVYLHAKAANGYKFLGWATSSTATTPLANSAVSEFAYTFTFDGSADNPTTRTLYAVFEQNGTPEPLPGDIEPSTDPSEFDYVMYLDDAEASTDTEVNLVLNMKNAVNDITGVEFNVCLPEGIEWTTTKNSRGETVLKTPTLNEERIQKEYHHVSVKEISEGVYKVIAYSDDNSNILLTDGALFYLPVTVSDDMEDGYYNIYIRDITMASQSVQQYRVEQTVSYIVVSSYTLGDVNNDGSINVTDIVATVSYLMGENPSPFVFKAADVNTDREINVTDIVGIIDIINGQSASRANAANGMRSGSYEDSEYALDIVYDGQNVTLNMNNTDYITAFQCDVELSDGVEWISENGRYAMPEFNEEAGRTDGNYHNISVKRLEDGKFRVIVYSLNNDEFFGTEGAVLNLPLAFTKGASCSISNIVLAKKNAGSEYLSSSTFSFDATNIDYIKNAQDANDVIFDINGVRSNKLMKGIYIINGAKVMVNE